MHAQRSVQQHTRCLLCDPLSLHSILKRAPPLTLVTGALGWNSWKCGFSEGPEGYRKEGSGYILQPHHAD